MAAGRTSLAWRLTPRTQLLRRPPRPRAAPGHSCAAGSHAGGPSRAALHALRKARRAAMGGAAVAGCLPVALCGEPGALLCVAAKALLFLCL